MLFNTYTYNTVIYLFSFNYVSLNAITGEFGVVYKAQYTEPEGDIGYKTSIVAVKTLKGKYCNIH